MLRFALFTLARAARMGEAGREFAKGTHGIGAGPPAPVFALRVARSGFFVLGTKRRKCVNSRSFCFGLELEHCGVAKTLCAIAYSWSSCVLMGDEPKASLGNNVSCAGQCQGFRLCLGPIGEVSSCSPRKVPDVESELGAP